MDEMKKLCTPHNDGQIIHRHVEYEESLRTLFSRLELLERKLEELSRGE